MILVCTATQTEHDAVVAGIHDSGASDGARDIGVLIVGVGPAHAAKSLHARLVDTTRPTPSRIVSTGFAGIVTGNVPFGAWITTEKLFDWDGASLTPLSCKPPRPLDALLIGTVHCDVVSTDHLVERGSKLRQVAVPGGEGRSLAVDMESVALAREAAARGIDFSVARLVSDTPRHPLPEFLAPFTAAMSSEGGFDRLTQAARGLRTAFGDPRGVARLLMEGKSWTRRLRAGWSTLADALTAEAHAEANPHVRARSLPVVQASSVNAAG